METNKKDGIIVKNLLNDAPLRIEFVNEYVNSGLTHDEEHLNKFKPSRCPYCGGNNFDYVGKSRKGLNLYECKDCHGKFSVITNTVFDGMTYPIKDWYIFLENLFQKNFLTKNTNQVFPQEDHEKFVALAKILFNSNWTSSSFRSREVEIHLFTYPNRNGNIEKTKIINPENHKNYIIAFASDGKKLTTSIVGAAFCNPKTILTKYKNAIPYKATLVTRPLNCFNQLIKANELRSKMVLGTIEQLRESYEYYRGVKLEDEFFRFLKVYRTKGMNLLLEYYMKVFEAVEKQECSLERKIAFVLALLINDPLFDDYENYLIHKDKFFSDPFNW